MVGKPANLLQLIRFIGRRKSAYLAIVELACELRFPQAASADPVKIFAQHRRNRPHAKCFQSKQHLRVCFIANIGQNLAIGAQFGRINDEGRAVHPIEVKIGKSARVAGFCLHVSFHVWVSK